jgi:hypothetical protein
LLRHRRNRTQRRLVNPAAILSHSLAQRLIDRERSQPAAHDGTGRASLSETIARRPARDHG